MAYLPCILQWHNVTLPPEVGNNYSTNNRSLDIFVPGLPAPHQYADISYIISSRIVVIICAFGIIGNILTFVLLLRRRRNLTQRRLHSATSSHSAPSDVWCFIALSVSDFLFCVCLLPQWFKQVNMTLYRGFSYMLLYERYEEPVLNTFVMSSTWLTVSMTLNRYFHLSHPIWAMRHLRRNFLLVAIFISISFSVLFNIPRCWFVTVDYYKCFEPKDLTKTYYLYWLQSAERSWEATYRWCYFIIGIIFPLCSLCYSNTRIIMAVCRSKGVEQRRVHERNIITKTLISVVLFYVCLVSPAELLKFFEGPISGYYSSPGTYGLVLSIANILQAINFSCNFLPYLIIDKTIREAFMHAACRKQTEEWRTTSVVRAQHQCIYEGLAARQQPRRTLTMQRTGSLCTTHTPCTVEMTRLPSTCNGSNRNANVN